MICYPNTITVVISFVKLDELFEYVSEVLLANNCLVQLLITE